MKKQFLLFAFAAASLLIPVCCDAQTYTRAEVKSVWEGRVMPSRANIDSTWNAVWFLRDNGYPTVVDSFMFTGMSSADFIDTIASIATSGIPTQLPTFVTGKSAGGVIMPALLFKDYSGSDSSHAAFYNWFHYTPGVNFPSPDTFYVTGYALFIDTVSTMKFTIYGSTSKTVQIHVTALNTWQYFSVAIPAGFSFRADSDILFKVSFFYQNKNTSLIYLNNVGLKAYSQ